MDWCYWPPQHWSYLHGTPYSSFIWHEHIIIINPSPFEKKKKDIYVDPTRLLFLAILQGGPCHGSPGTFPREVACSDTYVFIPIYMCWSKIK